MAKVFTEDELSEGTVKRKKKVVAKKAAPKPPPKPAPPPAAVDHRPELNALVKATLASSEATTNGSRSVAEATRELTETLKRPWRYILHRDKSGQLESVDKERI